MSRNVFGLMLGMLFLAGCSNSNNFLGNYGSTTKTENYDYGSASVNNKPENQCLQKPEMCDDSWLCVRGARILNGVWKWDDRPSFKPFADEARRRGLRCNVERSTVQSSNRDNLHDILMMGLDRVKNLSILSSEDVLSVKESLLKMPDKEYWKIIKICSSAFDNLEPQKCDAVLKSLSI